MIGEFGSTIENEPEESEDDSEKSSIKKIIGPVPDENKKIAKEEFIRRFKEQEFPEFEELKKIEIKKTPRQIEIINFVNDETNKLLEKYNLPEFNIPVDNVHILKEKDYYKEVFGIKANNYEKLEKQGKLKVETMAGGHSSIMQSIILKEISHNINIDLEFAFVTFHEFIHFKSFQSFRWAKDASGMYQLGLNLKLKSGKRLFNNLNEALTAELGKRFHQNILRKHPFFSKEIAKNEKIIKKHLWKKMPKTIIDDIFNIKPNVSVSNIDGKKTTTIDYCRFDYPKQRKILNTLIEKLYSKNKDKFQDKEQVFDLFAKSTFTGKLSWGRLVNQTFGKGTFKKLAQADENIDELEKFVSNLD